jgi:hypothetical protein
LASRKFFSLYWQFFFVLSTACIFFVYFYFSRFIYLPDSQSFYHSCYVTFAASKSNLNSINKSYYLLRLFQTSIIYTHLMCDFSFRGWAASNVEGYPSFRQTLQLPCSGWMCIGWVFLEALCRAGGRLRVECDHLPPVTFQKHPTNTHSPWRWQLQHLAKCWITFNVRRGYSPKTEVAHWTPAAKTWGQESHTFS